MLADIRNWISNYGIWWRDRTL